MNPSLTYQLVNFKEDPLSEPTPVKSTPTFFIWLYPTYDNFSAYHYFRIGPFFNLYSSLCQKNRGDKLGGGFKVFFVHPYLGKIPILTNILQRG